MIDKRPALIARCNDVADLFWAVRGGGNFGVVTAFLFRLHPIQTVYAGPILWPIEQAAACHALLPRLYWQGR
jgi:hypothetical protein